MPISSETAPLILQTRKYNPSMGIECSRKELWTYFVNATRW